MEFISRTVALGIMLSLVLAGVETTSVENSSVEHPEVLKLQHPLLPDIKLFEYESSNYTIDCKKLNLTSDDQILVVSNNVKIGGLLLENSSLPIGQVRYNCEEDLITLDVKAGRLGLTLFNVFVTDNSETVRNFTISVKTLRKMTVFDKVAFFVLGPLILFNKCAFGAKIELEVLQRVVTQPIELSLCLITQFIFMPLVAVFLSFVCNLNEVMALALLVAAACPGGGGGYVFSFLVDGDITLAITASLVSTLVAIVAMPSVIGIYTLTAHVPNEIRIPYLDILLMLLAIATPISFGMLVRKKWPDRAKTLIKVIRPLSLFLIVAGLLVVLSTSQYVMYGPKIGFLLAPLIPLSGFIIATGLARCLSVNWPLSKAVGLESGLKNTFLGVAVIELSFPQPEADLASILIIMVTIGQVVVSMIWYFLYLVKQCFAQPKKMQQTKYIKVDHNTDESDVDALETEFFLNQK
ncbi:sodium/bile acid cotransporter 5-like [Clavelina lepadiformis]|uniref:sodium/bile acid cotransporter 5-like n=1 Tax=Clavelina lepadiformis TaxID=159417 RepID=UPI00404166D8